MPKPLLDPMPSDEEAAAVYRQYDLAFDRGVRLIVDGAVDDIPRLDRTDARHPLNAFYGDDVVLAFDCKRRHGDPPLGDARRGRCYPSAGNGVREVVGFEDGDELLGFWGRLSCGLGKGSVYEVGNPPTSFLTALNAAIQPVGEAPDDDDDGDGNKEPYCHSCPS